MDPAPDPLDTLVAAVAPLSGTQIAAITASAPLAELADAIVALPARVDAVDEEALGSQDYLGLDGTGRAKTGARHAVLSRKPRRHRTRGRRWLVRAAAAAVLCAGAAGALLLRSPKDEARLTTTAERVAAEAPRVLPTEPGWSVGDAVSFSGDDGELTFAPPPDATSDGPALHVALIWRPAEQHQGYVDDRAASSGPPEEIAITGRPGVLFTYRGSGGFSALWVAGDHALELRGEGLDAATFRRLAEGLEEVDPDTWLAAMPADVVAEGDRAEAVQDMLSDVPVPQGFDRASLASGGMTADRYDLGAEVTKAVTCAWITQWDQATDAGDTALAQEAVDAMATARDWDILHEMQAQGAWPDYIWQWADALIGGTGIGPNHLPIISFCTNR